jgi:uncharacterized protein
MPLRSPAGLYNRYVTTDQPPDRSAAKPKGTTRRRLFKAAVGLVVGAGTLGAYARWVEPTWVQVVRQDLPVSHLPPAWEGKRVAFIADLHYGPYVSLDYLASVVQKVQALKPDLIVLGGDLVLSPDRESAQTAARLFEGVTAPFGVFACLGNHDYTFRTDQGVATGSEVDEALTLMGVRVLRNESVRLECQDQYLWIVGSEDMWSGHFQPGDVTRGLPAGAPSLVLCHNPEPVERLEAVGCGTILSGHTHGGQVQVPLLGPVHLQKRFGGRYQGLHHVGNSWLYITRGVGSLYGFRFNCRPEISLLTLQAAPEEKPATPAAKT